MFGFSDLVLRLRVDERPNRIEKAVVLKICVDRALVLSDPTDSA